MTRRLWTDKKPSLTRLIIYIYIFYVMSLNLNIKNIALPVFYTKVTGRQQTQNNTTGI